MTMIETLFEATLASSAATVLVLVLRIPLRRAFGARVAYGAWGLVPALLVAVLLPAAEIAPAGAIRVALPRMLPVAAPSVAPAFDPGLVLAACWLAGLAAAVLWMAARQRGFRRSLGRLSPRMDGVHESEREVEGLPATLGLWSPRVVVPPSFERRYDTAQRELMLAHERAHVQRGDVQANAVAAALRCLFWFNPLLHYAGSRFRQDQELACDATVLGSHPQARRRYGEALLQAQLVAQATPLGCHFGFSHPLKERLAMLKEQLPSSPRRTIGALLVSILALGAAFAAWATQPPQALAGAGTSQDIEKASTPPPGYPPYAFEHHLGGLVVMQVDVAADGHVTGVVIERSEPEGIFDEAALSAVAKWKFNPRMEDGKPVAGKVRVPITFAPGDAVKDKETETVGREPDPAAYDWKRIDLSAESVAEVSCDVMRGNIGNDVMYCGKRRR